MKEIAGNMVSMTMSSRDDVRYIAPELASSINASPTVHSDTYSFALLALECITEEIPFSRITSDAAVVHARFVKAMCPPRPRPDRLVSNYHISDGLWVLMERCWCDRPERRPTMESVHSFFMNDRNLL